RAAAGLGVGLALASAPGPVQAVLMAESVRGGVIRGFKAMAGASFTFGLLLVGLALGVSVAPPSGLALRILRAAGGALLGWLAIGDGTVVLLGGIGVRRAGERVRLVVRRLLATLLAGLGVWLFLSGLLS